MRAKTRSGWVLLAMLWMTSQASAYQTTTVVDGLEFPWSLAFLPDGRMLVTERPGRLRIIANDGLVDAPVSGLPPIFSSGQAGLFDVLIDPDFAHNQLIYLSFAHGDKANNQLRVVRAELHAGALQNLAVLFTVMPAKRGNAHFGGRMAWLADGSLVIGTGEGFDYREQAQRLDNHLGKIIRIRSDGKVPKDNPFLSNANARPEIYSLGHRNVQGMVFDTQTQTLYAHEHGPRGGDEINIIRAGKNYGWPLISYGVDYTGALITPFTERAGLEQPILHWTPSIAPAGMAMVRGSLFPQWQGSLLVAALAGKRVQRVPIAGGKTGAQETLFSELQQRIRDVRVGPEGAVYLLTDSADGAVLRITPDARD